MFKHFEFWNPRLFEAPYYVYLAWRCLVSGITPKTLPKANYALDHGEIGIGSKLENQFSFDQKYFLPSILIPETAATHEKAQLIETFSKEHGFPLILKSDVGCVGKGVTKINNKDDIQRKTPLLLGNFILQKFTTFPFEAGIFYTRSKGQAKITGINVKHFPTVVGNGVDSIGELAKKHPRHTHHWGAFLQELNLNEVLHVGEEKRLSFIGSHTLGCKFTDDTKLLTPALEKAIFEIFVNQPGFNFGRVDVKAKNKDALLRGEFVVIEVNGIASLPTNMFDPSNSVLRAYKIFLRHGKQLVQIAKENKNVAMELSSYSEVIKRISKNQKLLNQVHAKLMGR